MSGGRRHQRALNRHRVKRIMAEADTQPAELVAVTEDNFEVWRKGRVAFVLPAIPAGAPVDVRNGLAARRVAAIRGVCDCGARRDVRPGRVAFIHEHNCPASDEAIAAAWRAWRAT
jgi:hypothetical protein